jgi:hypothetical protein
MSIDYKKFAVQVAAAVVAGVLVIKLNNALEAKKAEAA